MLADRMTASNAIPTVSIFSEWSAEPLVRSRERLNDGADAPGRARVTYTHLMIHALARALQKHPHLNATIEDEYIHLLEDINIGLAVALPDGGLMVPVIRNPQRRSIVDLAAEVSCITADARAGKLRPRDFRGATFTMTNVGVLQEARWQTPLIPESQCAILAIGAVREAPVVRDGALAVGRVMSSSLSFDHRIVSGLPACEFLATIAQLLAEEPAPEIEGRPDLNPASPGEF
jgi:pyruvate/2-oxoglutarate dehydrogenase complex dihydrolipoamide acyltransferase (E2) component